MYYGGFLGGRVVKKKKKVKNLPANAGNTRCRSIPGLGRFPWSRGQPAPVFLPEKFHGQRSLVGYRSWGHKESDMMEHSNFLTNLICGNLVLCELYNKDYFSN